MVSPLTSTITISDQVARQLRILGYRAGDRVWLRLLKPKNIPLDVAHRRGMAFEPEPGKVIPVAIDGYLTLGKNDPTFTRVYRNGKENLYQSGLNFLAGGNDQGYGVYLVVNPGGREDAEIAECRTLFYECDEVSKAEQWKRLQALERELGGKASLAIETRNSLHIYFKLDTPLDPETWRQYQQRLIQQQDSDRAIHNPARLMRLAGFNHQKWNAETQNLEATPVTIQKVDGATFTIEELDAVLPAWDAAQWRKAPHEGDRTPTNASEDAWDIRNFSSYLDGYNPNGRRGWITCKCPAHNGQSDDSLHIEESTGAFTCHSGCNSKAVYQAAIDLAQARGYQLPAKGNRKGKRKPKALDLPTYDLTYEADVVSRARYLENIEVPAGEKLVCLRVPKGCGKTEWIAARIVASGVLQSGKCRIWVLTYRESLGKQLAKRFGLSYKTEIYDTPEGQLFGFCLCVDSAHPDSEARFTGEGKANDWVIVDEAESVFSHLVNSSTCDSKRVAILRQIESLFVGVLHPDSTGRMILADADLSDLTVDYAKRQGQQPDLKPFVITSSWKPEQGWQGYSYEEPADLYAAMMGAINQGGNHLILTTGQKADSKWGTQTLEAAVLSAERSGLPVLRIDSETISNPEHPAFGCMEPERDINQLMRRYPIAICSNTLESGVSLDQLEGYYAGLWQFATGVTPENSVRQFPARLRDNFHVPRHFYIAERGINTAFIGNGETDPVKLHEAERKKGAVNFRAIQDSGVTIAADGSIHSNPAALELWGKIGARINKGLHHYRESVLAGFRAEGHTISQGTALSPEERAAIGEAVGALRDSNHQQVTEAIAQTEPPLTEAAYEELKQKRAKTDAERYSQRNYELQQRYASDVTVDLVQRDDAGWYPQIRLQYFLTIGAQFLKPRDSSSFEKLADPNGTAFLPDVQKKLLSHKVEPLKLLKVDELLAIALAGEEVHQKHPSVLEIFNRASQAKDLKDWVGVDTPKAGDSPMSFVQDLLSSLLGFRLCKRGQRTILGDRLNVYGYRYLPGAKGKAGQNLSIERDQEIAARDVVFGAWLKRDSERLGLDPGLTPALIATPQSSRNESEMHTESPIDLKRTSNTQSRLGSESAASIIKPIPASKPDPIPDPEKPILHHQGFSVGDCVRVSIDHFDKATQREIVRNKEAPVGSVGTIVAFRLSAYMQKLGRTLVEPVIQVDGENVSVPASYLRRLGAEEAIA